jgi:hypothetical protein
MAATAGATGAAATAAAMRTVSARAERSLEAAGAGVEISAAEAAADDGAPAWPAPAAPAVVSTFLRFLTHDGAACADAGASLRTPVAGAAAATSESVVSSAADRRELRALRGFSATAKATERRRRFASILNRAAEMPSRSHPGRNTGSGNPDLWSCRVLSVCVVSIELRCENACIITCHITTSLFRTSLTLNTQ